MRDEQVARPRKGRAEKLGQVCTAITAATGEEMARKATAAFALGTDIVEFRVDHAGEPPPRVAKGIARFREKAIFTVRRKEEGGRFAGTEEERLEVISELAGLGPLYLDIELSTANENPGWFAALPDGPRKIVSWHDFRTTPPSAILERKRDAAGVLGDVAKVVTTSRSEQDNLRVLKLYEEDPASLIAFCMGERGTVSRIEAFRLGSPVVYASLPGEPVAAGQLSVETVAGMKRLWEAE